MSTSYGGKQEDDTGRGQCLRPDGLTVAETDSEPWNTISISAIPARRVPFLVRACLVRFSQLARSNRTFVFVRPSQIVTLDVPAARRSRSLQLTELSSPSGREKKHFVGSEHWLQVPPRSPADAPCSAACTLLLQFSCLPCSELAHMISYGSLGLERRRTSITTMGSPIKPPATYMWLTRRPIG